VNVFSDFINCFHDILTTLCKILNDLNLIFELIRSFIEVIFIRDDHFFNFIKRGLCKKFECTNSSKFIPKTFVKLCFLYYFKTHFVDLLLNVSDDELRFKVVKPLFFFLSKFASIDSFAEDVMLFFELKTKKVQVTILSAVLCYVN